MLENVKNTTETVGGIRQSRTLFSGQAQTREYTDAEKPTTFKGRDNLQLGQRWADPKLGDILAQDNQ